MDGNRLSPKEQEYVEKLAQVYVALAQLPAEQQREYGEKIQELKHRLERLTPEQKQVYDAKLHELARQVRAKENSHPVSEEKPKEEPTVNYAEEESERQPEQWQAAVSEETEDEPDDEEEPAKPEKKKKRGLGCFVVILVVLVLVFAAAGLGGTAVLREINGSRGQVIETATVEIEQGAGLLSIGTSLEEAGIIQSAQLFRVYVKIEGVAPSLQYGTFELSSDMTYDEILEALQQPQDNRDTVRVTFPEGIPAVQFAQRMEEAGLCTAQEFLDVANNGDFSQFTFWNKRDENPDQFMACEGYLFPDTYDFFVGDDVYNMVAKIYGEFDKKFTEEMYQKVEEMGFTLSEFVTLASIVQEEAGGAEHQADVAAVFMNRLAENSPVPRLESNCASYIKNDNDNNYINNTIAPYYGGWENIPQNIIDNYDTYNVEGLPAGPISNPGLEAMTNTLRYAESPYYGDYYFFVTDTLGNYYFNKTAEEHQAQVDKQKAEGTMPG